MVLCGLYIFIGKFADRIFLGVEGAFGCSLGPPRVCVAFNFSVQELQIEYLLGPASICMVNVLALIRMLAVLHKIAYAHIHLHAHTHAHTHVLAFMHIGVYVNAIMCKYTQAWVCAQIHVQTDIRVCIRRHACVFTRSDVLKHSFFGHMHVQAYARMCMRIHPCASAPTHLHAHTCMIIRVYARKCASTQRHTYSRLHVQANLCMCMRTTAAVHKCRCANGCV